MSDAMYAAASLYNDPRYFSKSEIRIRNNAIRRKKIVRRQMISLLLVIAVITFISVFMASSFMSDAESNDFVPECKYYKSVTIHVNDTIWSIASDNFSKDHYDNINKYVSEIMKLNKIGDCSKIYAGESIIIPYYAPIE